MRSEVDWQAIAAAVRAEAGLELDPRGVQAVGGGCIHRSFRVAARGGACFVKVDDAAHAGLFDAEADGLEALARAAAVRVPAVRARGVVASLAYLALEWIEAGPPGERAGRLLGAQLAALHRHCHERYGWHRDNALGRTRQPNGWCTDWAEFMRVHRIGFQLELAARAGCGARLRDRGARLVEILDRFFARYRPPASLLHGDLWEGNCFADAGGRPVVFDPAVHYGDREADIAMTELFGGFGADFYAAYSEAWPLDEGYAVRRDLYQLYHLLNHLNLFGSGYLAPAQRLIDRLLGAARA
jgi:fructosamine-3-kinase